MVKKAGAMLRELALTAIGIRQQGHGIMQPTLRLLHHVCRASQLYRDRRQDVAPEMERN